MKQVILGFTEIEMNGAGAWLLGLFVLATGIEKVLAVVKHVRNKSDMPQPLVVKQEQPVATKAELAAIELDVKALEQRLEGKMNALTGKLDGIKTQMHQNHVTELSAAETRSHQTNERINDLYELIARSGLGAALQKARGKDGL